jgi:hypothetical protein
MGLEEKVELAMLLLERLRRQGRPEGEPPVVSRRDLFVLAKNRFKTVERMDPSLEILCRHGWIQPTGLGHNGRGYKSPKFLVNPLVWEES